MDEERVQVLSRRVLCALGVVVAIVFGSTPMAGAASGPVFTSPGPSSPVGPIGVTYPITVSGSFVPLPMGCGSEKRVLWYAPGAAPDRLWRNVTFPMSGAPRYTSSSVSVSGTYKPFTGDFNGDGCEDVFWYAPGSARDAVWYFAPNGTYRSSTVSVSGTYLPVVGRFDGDDRDDIFWYAPGSGREVIWRGSATRGSFTSAVAPQVSGTYTPVLAVDSSSILWFRSGPGADFLWRGIAAGATAPGASSPTTVSGTYTARNIGGTALLYAPGPGRDQLVVGSSAASGSVPVTLRTVGGAINGTYRVSNSTARAGFGVLHGPGSAPDHLIDAQTHYVAPPLPASSILTYPGLGRSLGLGTDRIAVWGCRVAGRAAPNPSSVASWAQGAVTPYFDKASRGRYKAVFTGAGTVSVASEGQCLQTAMDSTHSPYSNTMVVSSEVFGGGYGSSGFIWDDGRGATLATPPSANGRGFFVGSESFSPDANPGLVIHELGHTLHWPHSYRGGMDEYDNPLDVMSAWTELSWCPSGGSSFYTCKAQNTLAFNRFASGWVDANQIVVHTGGSQTVNLSPPGSGVQMVAATTAATSKAMITIEARPPTGYDAILEKGGIAVHVVDQRKSACGEYFLNACVSLWRRQGQAWGAPLSYDHVLAPGESRTIYGVTITAGALKAGRYPVTVTGTPTIPSRPLAGASVIQRGSPAPLDDSEPRRPFSEPHRPDTRPGPG